MCRACLDTAAETSNHQTVIPAIVRAQKLLDIYLEKGSIRYKVLIANWLCVDRARPHCSSQKGRGRHEERYPAQALAL